MAYRASPSSFGQLPPSSNDVQTQLGPELEEIQTEVGIDRVTWTKVLT